MKFLILTEWQKAIDLGVKGIQTDDPEKLIQSCSLSKSYRYGCGFYIEVDIQELPCFKYGVIVSCHNETIDSYAS